MRFGDSVGETIKHVAVSRRAQRHLHADPHSHTHSRARLNSALRETSADLVPWRLGEVFEFRRSLTQASLFVRSKQDLVSLSLSFSRTSLDAEGDYDSVLPGSSLTCFVSQNHQRYPKSKSSVDYINSLSYYTTSLITPRLPHTRLSKKGLNDLINIVQTTTLLSFVFSKLA